MQILLKDVDMFVKKYVINIVVCKSVWKITYFHVFNKAL
jgi:hypothetical protein